MIKRFPLLRRPTALLAVFTAFAALTLLLHPDIALHPDTAVLGGDSAGGYFVWQLWRLAKVWKEGGEIFFTRLVFHPAGADIFLQSPAMEGAGLLLQKVMSPNAAFNLLLLATYPLAGTAAFSLLKQLGTIPSAAFFSAFTYAFSAYMLNQHRHGHLNETAIFFSPLAVTAVIAFWRRPGAWSWAGVLTAGAGLLLADPYIAFYCGGFLAVGSLLFDGIFQKGAWLKGLVSRMTPGRLAAAALPLPVLTAYWPLLRGAGEWLGAADRMPMYVLAHVHPPVWHRSAWWGKLFFRGDFMTEETIGYIGLVPLALLGVIVFRRLWRTVPGLSYWLWITLFAGVMSWGPTLRLSPSLKTSFPLPYALVQALPFLDNFRTVSRAWLLGTLACAVWTGLSLTFLAGRWGRARQWVLAGTACLVWAWDLDLPQIRQWRFFIRRDMSVYSTMKEDPVPGALLELPNGPDSNGDLPACGFLYLLHQPLHGRPLVLGTIARHKAASLAFTENTPGLRELTHPWTLAPLEKNPARAAWLAANAGSILSQNGIRYVLWHRRVKAFIGLEEESLVQPYLERWFGPPVARDGEDHLLYRVDGERKNGDRPGLTRRS